jgi:biotin carboxyl carrier protein
VGVTAKLRREATPPSPEDHHGAAPSLALMLPKGLTGTLLTMDVDLVRHALSVARDRGFAEVELSGKDGAFSARLDPIPSSGAAAKPGVQDEAELQIGEIRSSLVGFYRPATEPLEVGRTVQKGEVVAIVVALGIANDVESKVSGTVVEVIAAPNQSVEYGQVLAKVRLG